MSKGTPFEEWMLCLKNERPGVLITVLKVSSDARLSVGTHLFVSEEGNYVGSIGDLALDRHVLEVAQKKLTQLHPKSETYTLQDAKGREIEVFIDVNVPPLQLIIFGAGHDAVPVAKLSVDLGFRTIVVDPRPAYATEERFPGTQIVLAHPAELEQNIYPNRRTYMVIMNHHLERDQICLRFALKSQSAYIGVLGPLKRGNRLLNALQDQGVVFSNDQLSRMYNPIGLDLGADSSTEVALSILSEILAVRNGHEGGFLRGKRTIH